MNNTEHAVIVPFSRLGDVLESQIGTKASSLGTLVKARLPVPNGFVITTGGFNYHFVKSRLNEFVSSEMYDIDPSDSVRLENITNKIRTRILKMDIDGDLKEAISRSYASLSGFSDSYVAVRSSIPRGTSKKSPYTGQYESFLNVKGKDDLIEKVKQCWASLFTPQNVFYSLNNGVELSSICMGVIVQKMIQAEVSGIVFTVNPIDNDDSKISIECVLGLGESLGLGEVAPDTYVVEKKTGKIIEKKIVPQDWMLVRKGKVKAGEDPNVKVKVSDLWKVKQKIENKYIDKLVKIGKDVEGLFKSAQEIEWVYEGGRIWIVQSRNITTLKIDEDSWKKTPTFAALKSKVGDLSDESNVKIISKKKKDEDRQINEELEKENAKVLLKGNSTSKGLVSGSVKVIDSVGDLKDIQRGTILVTKKVTSDFEGKVGNIVAIIVDQRGRDSYETIIARSLGVPCIVDTDVATKVMHDGEYATVDGDNGTVSVGVTNEGLLAAEKIIQNRTRLDDKQGRKQQGTKQESDGKGKIKESKYKTATKLYLDLDNPNEAPSYTSLDVEGVSDLNSDLMIKALGFHPKVAASRKKDRNKFVENLVLGIYRVAKSFDPRPVIYKLSDMSAAEYIKLAGGNEFETGENNPMLGFRGASRYIYNTNELEMELEAIRIIRNKENIRNVWLSIPYVRTYEELREIKQLISSFGFRRSSTFKLFLIVQVPSAAIRIEEFIEIGIDGVVIDVDLLQQLIVGFDRTNPRLSTAYNEVYPAVLWAIERVLRICNKEKIHSQVKGSMFLTKEDFIKGIVKWGATSVVTKPRLLEQVRENIYDSEKNIILKKK